jgi:hypothetical protein
VQLAFEVCGILMAFELIPKLFVICASCVMTLGISGLKNETLQWCNYLKVNTIVSS